MYVCARIISLILKSGLNSLFSYEIARRFIISIENKLMKGQPEVSVSVLRYNLLKVKIY